MRFVVRDPVLEQLKNAKLLTFSKNYSIKTISIIKNWNRIYHDLSLVNMFTTFLRILRILLEKSK